MKPEPVIAIIDVGKTNKKLFLFNEEYAIVYERSIRFTDTTDEDDFPCEDLEILGKFVRESIEEVQQKQGYQLKAINFSAYGASLVYIDCNSEAIAPLYNYLKPFPEEIKKDFYNRYGNEDSFSLQSASPSLGSLNSGLQLYRLKKERPELLERIQYALHLPQYVSFLFSGIPATDITSIGCHTAMWDFVKNDYHRWIMEEGLHEKLAPLYPCSKIFPVAGNDQCKVGIGLHDSSAALIPYLVSFDKPFILISTGTWCISLNPFNKEKLTIEELKLDCLSYLHHQGKAVKASRLFGGNEHDEQVKRIAAHFHKSSSFFESIEYNDADAELLEPFNTSEIEKQDIIFKSLFTARDLSGFPSEKEAYYQLMHDIITQQAFSTRLIMSDGVQQIFVDGGFGRNPIYMNMLAKAFPDMAVFAASMSQATALGAALAIHDKWNSKKIPPDLIEIQDYTFRSK